MNKQLGSSSKRVYLWSSIAIAGMTLVGLSVPLGRHAVSRTPSDFDWQIVAAARVDEFLNSLGVNTHADQGYSAQAYVAPLRYLGVRNIRDGGRNRAGLIMLQRETGVRVDLLGGAASYAIPIARILAATGALLAVEGPNEPNNFPVTYNGRKGGGTESWLPVAELQRDLYQAVKSDPDLNRYPVFHVSEGGAEIDNVGLQFLTIPAGSSTLLPEGTRFADFANPHNYVSGHGNVYLDNQAWHAADPTLNSRIWDGLWGEYGKTWRKGFAGYSDAELETLPRVTTETGWDSVGSPGGERVQGTVLVNTYLSQFKRGWKYTFIYELHDNEGGNGHQGLLRDDWSPKPAAIYIHNLTTILADHSAVSDSGRLEYAIQGQSAAIHDLMLRKNGSVFDLVIWGERVGGSESVKVKLNSVAETIEIFDVMVGEQPVEVKHNTAELSLDVSDHALILQIHKD
jgi:hypothetical protein